MELQEKKADLYSLKDIISAQIIHDKYLLAHATNVNDDLQRYLAEKIITLQIKPALFPIELETPINSKSMEHQGVCGLETISKSRQIISVGCDGKIAICDEHAMDRCEVVNTKSSWYCATMQCEPPTLCLGGLSGKIGFMGLKDKEPQRIFEAHAGSINGIALSADQKNIVSCSNDRLVKLWDVSNNKKLATFTGHTKAVKNAFSILAHQKLISGSADQSVRLWDIGTQKQEHHYSLRETALQFDTIFRLARHPHEQTAVAGINNGMVALYDLRKNQFAHCLKGHKSVISALICSDDGNYIASGSWDGNIRLWDLRMMACSAIVAYHEDWVQNVSSLYDFSRIVSGSRDGTVKLWDVSTVLAVDRMNSLKETAAKAALIASENPISHDARLNMLKRITAK